MKDRAGACQTAQAGWGFGVDKAQAAAMLRELAADIEAGGVILNRIEQSIVAPGDEFGFAVLTLKFSERVSGPAVVIEAPSPDLKELLARQAEVMRAWVANELARNPRAMQR
jgi:hypothetical protein